MFEDKTIPDQKANSIRGFKWKKIYWHLLFWLFYIVLTAVRTPGSRVTIWNSFLQIIIYLPVLIPATYFTIFVLIKKYLFKKKYFRFAVYMSLCGFGFALLNRIIFFYIAVPKFYPEFAERIYSVGLFDLREMLSFFISVISLIAFAGFITFITEWYSQENVRQQLMKEKYEAELKFLKTQIHPHFLFNMLNNLYALSLKKSDKAPEMILKISSLLDYMLHEANSSSVTLGREIEVLKDYIELEMIRYGDKIHLTINIDGDVEGKRIAPLLLLPFLENSFKHGAGEELEDAWISFSLKAEDTSLSMQLVNSRSKSINQDNQTVTKGIGFENVKRRLSLLYDKGYALDIQAFENSYTVLLKINLHKLKELIS